MIKIAQEGDWPLIGEINSSYLGAPFWGNQNDFPINNRTYWLAGYLARIFGLFPAVNMMMIGFHLLAAFSFYIAARLWRISRLYAWGFSVAYSMLPQFHMSIDYFGVLSFGLLPLQFYTCWYIATVPIFNLKSSRFRLTVIVSIISSSLNVYWVFLFIQFYILALLRRVVRRSSGFFYSLLPIGITLLGVFIFLSNHILYNIKNEKNVGAVIRNYSEVERHSMMPMDLFIPQNRPRFNPMRFTGLYYTNGAINLMERQFAYIGILSSISIFLLLFRAVYFRLMGRAISFPLLVVLWLIAYSSIGGANAILSLLFDFYKIKATVRYSIAIASVLLLYLAFFTDKITLLWRSIYRMTLIAFLCFIGLGDQVILPYRIFHARYTPEKIGSLINEDRMLVAQLESALPRNSMLYLLPVQDFPEPFLGGRGKTKDNFSLYELMRPYLHSTRLSYSYGSNKGRQGADWQLDVQELPAGEMVRALESYGFAGILLNRNGYEDRGEALLAELAQAGWPIKFEQGIDNEWVFIRLTPAENPVLPTLTPYAVTMAK